MISFCEFAINFVASMRYTALSGWRMVRTLLPTMIITAAMYASVVFVGDVMSDTGVAPRLVAEIATGVVVYILLAFGFRLEAATEIKSLLSKILRK